MKPHFPVETLDGIFQYLSSDDHTRLLRVNRLFYEITARILYHTIPELPMEQSLACLVSLRDNGFTSSLVRHLTVIWKTISLHRRSELHSGFTTLLHSCLKELRRLNSLCLHFDELDSISLGRLILPDCLFSLTNFTTSLACDQFLVSFLENQPRILSLDLTLVPWSSRPSITLNHSALPRLKSFNSPYGDPQFVAEFLRDRPVEHVRIRVDSRLGYDVLDTLKLSSRPIRTLSIVFRDVKRNPLPNLTISLPELEELNICLARMEWYKPFNVNIRPLLPQFPALKTLRILSGEKQPICANKAQQIMSYWHNSVAGTVSRQKPLPPQVDMPSRSELIINIFLATLVEGKMASGFCHTTPV